MLVLSFLFFFGGCRAASTPTTPPAPPAWCARTLEILKQSANIVPPRDLSPPDAASAEALAQRMSVESAALGTLDRHEAVHYATEASSVVSAAAWSLASRRHKDPGDAESAARGLAIALRRREHAERALRGHCAGAAPTLEPSREWRERAFETVRSLQPEIQTCRERAAEDERPLRMHVLVHLEPSGRLSLAVPVDVAFEHARWGATDAAHCIVKRLESVTFPLQTPTSLSCSPPSTHHAAEI